MIDRRLKQAHGHLEREEWGQAWPIASDLLNESPDDARPLYVAGVVMRQMGHIGVALQLFRKALADQRRIPNIWMHYGACLHDTHQYAQAREAFEIVAKALPGDPMPWANMAGSFVQEGKPRDAVEAADKALKLAENWPDPAPKARAVYIANVARAFGCLALGRWAEGWKSAAYLYGDHLRIRVYNPPEKEEPEWDGTKGQTIVVQADQGLGDMIMFAQMLPQLIRDCKKVIVETDPRLVGLFQRNFPEADVYGTLRERTDLEWPSRYQIDAHIHISFLGKFYRNRDEDFPRTAYLKPDPALAQKWKERLSHLPKPVIGIAWKGGIQRTNEASRSMKLAELAPLIRGSMVSLAYQEVGLEVARWNIDHETQILVPEMDEDYDDTVALISQLDRVITVTTTVAHVCGALGKTADVLVNQSPQWRYCHGGDHLMWYPDSLTLHRQKPGETGWSHAIARLAKMELACA